MFIHVQINPTNQMLTLLIRHIGNCLRSDNFVHILQYHKFIAILNKMYLISIDTYSSNKNSQNNALKKWVRDVRPNKLEQPSEVNLFIRQSIVLLISWTVSLGLL